MIGQLVRRNGNLTPLEKESVREIQFKDETLSVRPVTWGDLSTAYRTTAIPNITVYFPVLKKFPNVLKLSGVSTKELNSNTEAKKKVQNWIEEHVQGPDELTRQTDRSYIWVSVSNDEGISKESWLETMESYRFTAVAGVRCVEKVFELQTKGALTPASAFGADFVLDFPETVRYDSLTN
jgi:short subunit dehydrogenase-like uncharacterized protein